MIKVSHHPMSEVGKTFLCVLHLANKRKRFLKKAKKL